MFIQISYPYRSSSARALPHEHLLRLRTQTAARPNSILDDASAQKGPVLASLITRSKIAGNTNRTLDCRDAPLDRQPRGIGRVSQMRAFRLRGCLLRSMPGPVRDEHQAQPLLFGRNLCHDRSLASNAVASRAERAPTNGGGHGQSTKRGNERLQCAGHELLPACCRESETNISTTILPPCLLRMRRTSGASNRIFPHRATVNRRGADDHIKKTTLFFNHRHGYVDALGKETGAADRQHMCTCGHACTPRPVRRKFYERGTFEQPADMLRVK